MSIHPLPHSRPRSLARKPRDRNRVAASPRPRETAVIWAAAARTRASLSPAPPALSPSLPPLRPSVGRLGWSGRWLSPPVVQSSDTPPRACIRWGRPQRRPQCRLRRRPSPVTQPPIPRLGPLRAKVLVSDLLGPFPPVRSPLRARWTDAKPVPQLGVGQPHGGVPRASPNTVHLGQNPVHRLHRPAPTH